MENVQKTDNMHKKQSGSPGTVKELLCWHPLAILKVSWSGEGGHHKDRDGLGLGWSGGPRNSEHCGDQRSRNHRDGEDNSTSPESCRTLPLLRTHVHGTSDLAPLGPPLIAVSSSPQIPLWNPFFPFAARRFANLISNQPSFITPQKTLTPSFTSHKSQKSHSVLSTLMEICSWCDSDAGKISWRRSDSGRDCDPFVSYKLPVNRSSKGHIWRYLWRKIRKEKRRVFDCSNSMRFTYDPHSYSQNFDDRSSIFADEDELSRSFSARFAVPCRIFPKNNLVA